MIVPEQFGFQKGISTETAISHFIEKVYCSLDGKKTSTAVFVDFCKAFETVNHDILLKKIHQYGFRGKPLELLSSYLSNRTHVTRIGGYVSSTKPVTMSVPQGSHLGPILFLLYVNDIPNISDSFSPILFADDLTLNFTCENENYLVENCNREIDKLVSWTQINRLTINYDKTFFLIITNKNFVRPQP